jgi:hypothetical protein
MPPGFLEAARRVSEGGSALDPQVVATPKGGAPVHHPPAGQAKPGDELEIDSLDYAGSHSHHARQWSASDHLRCVFGAGGQPDCQGQAAVGGSLLLFAGERLVGGTGRYEGATGNVRSRDRAGGSDIVITIHPPR